MRRTSIWVTGVPLPGWMFSIGDDDAELAVDLDDIAFSQRAGDDFHGFLDVLPLDMGRTIAILSPIATYFLCVPAHKDMAGNAADPPRSSPFWAPHVHADRRPVLLARGRIVAALRAWFAGAGFHRGRDRRAAGFAGQRDPSACLRHHAGGAGRHVVARFICAPRRNSPARSSWRPASAASSNSPRCFATASAARCTIRNSPWSNGIAPASPMRR